jgi:ATP-binding cassette subfamily F protein uup
LSGGERNRLLLARLLTRPANVLILDEPTNDLDIETLELLEAELTAFPGTILLVSHDRRFLDNLVTSTLVFEGGGRIEEYVGGHADWLRQRRQPAAAAPPVPRVPELDAPKRETARKRLSYKEQREFDELPAKIEVLEAEQAQLSARVAASSFYKEPAATISQVLARIDAIPAELDALYRRWAEFEDRTK